MLSSYNVDPIGQLKIQNVRSLSTIGKIYDCSWSSNSQNFITLASGVMYCYDPLKTDYLWKINCFSSKTITCSYGTKGRLVACGGIECSVNIFNIESSSIPNNKNKIKNLFRKKKKKNFGSNFNFTEHQGWISSCLFIDETSLASSSGDTTCHIIDIEKQKSKNHFVGHEQDVVCVEYNSKKPNNLISGSSDGSARLWDIRTNSAVHTFLYENEVDDISFFPDGNAFASINSNVGSMYDLRTNKLINQYRVDDVTITPNIAFSSSGRILFISNADNNIICFDTLTTKKISSFTNHTENISTLRLSPNGYALLSVGWDSKVNVWA
ncbi:guanine nucleotide-binding protein subunit beta-1 [Anaeramoeba flamelloides]|uniref:Guanine nucleotide-binding protein subunit beta-1 n=1 Tax=Anaeramoeba flamelloides TaxID=1746091 RepID=A0ABQ8Z2A1_9EUKA|nr:guanine nucleotide-binding protein subunit beta-1 [Anaeramoeba flamelloides]